MHAAAMPCDKGLPLPKRMVVGRPHSPAGATFRTMKVGESFVYPPKNGEPHDRTRHRACSMFRHFRPKRFAARSVVEDGKTVLRVWRIA